MTVTTDDMRFEKGTTMRMHHTGCVAALAIALSAHADVTFNWTSPSQFDWTIAHIPDIDQRRSSLPVTGNWYCAPAANLNLFAYFASHGLFDLPPGPGNFQSQQLYAAAGAALSDVGDAMGTLSPGGTTGDGMYAGVVEWLPANKFAVVHHRDSSTSTPGFATINYTVANGGFAAFAIGYYLDHGPYMTREGGHVVTASRAIINDPAYGIGFRDPWTSDSLQMQSTFATRFCITLPEQRRPREGAQERAMWRVFGMDASEGAWHGYIDEVLSIYPTFVLTDYADIDITATIVRSNPLQGGGVPLLREFAPVGGRELVDMTIHADLTCAVTILVPVGGGEREVWTLKPAGDGVWEQLDINVFDPSDPLVNRHRELYLIDGIGTLHHIDIAADPPVTRTIMSPLVPGQALAYDDVHDLLLVYSAKDGKLMEYDRTLLGIPTAWDLPGVPFASEASIAWNPVTGDRWICVEGQLFRMSYGGDEFEQVIIDAPNPVAIDFDDDGRLYVSAEGVIMEFDFIGGKWMYPPDPIFPEQPAGGFLHVSRSSTNYDPTLHDGPGWNNIELEPGDQGGESIPDCVADVNGDGVVGVPDLVAVLAAWNSSDPFADVNADLNVDLQDLLAVLVAWGPCEE